MFFPDKEKSFRAVHRVLSPRGRYVFSVWDSHSHNPFGRLAHEVVGGFFSSDPPQFYQVPFGYHQIDPIKEALIVAGFTDIRVAVLSIEKEVTNAESLARGLVYGNPLIDQIRARGSVDPEQVIAALAKALRLEFGADPGQAPLQSITFEASRR